MGKAKETSLAKADDGMPLADIQEYPIIAQDAQRRDKIMKANMGPEGLSIRNLDRISIPTGGIMQFELPSLSGPVMSPTFEGVVIARKDTRIRWETPIGEGGSNQPACTCPDLAAAGQEEATGIGDPGGVCRTCEYSQFGSAAKGGGQACQQRLMLFFIRPGESIPVILNLPPTSLKSASEYFSKLQARFLGFWEVVTEVGLKEVVNEAGIKYAQTQFRVSSMLAEADRPKFEAIYDAFQAIVRQASVATEAKPDDGPTDPF